VAGPETVEVLEFPRVGLYSELLACSPMRGIEEGAADK